RDAHHDHGDDQAAAERFHRHRQSRLALVRVAPWRHLRSWLARIAILTHDRTLRERDIRRPTEHILSSSVVASLARSAFVLRQTRDFLILGSQSTALINRSRGTR